MYCPEGKHASCVGKQSADCYLTPYHSPDSDVKKHPPGGGVFPTPPAAEPIIGTSPHAEALRQIVGTLSAASDNVLVIGEPGAGKRFLARCIHEQSFRPPRSLFVEVSLQTREEELRVILFNEERKKHEGILGHALPRLARRTTLFVRNIHEFSFLAQTRVARFLIQNEQTAAQAGEAVRVVFSLPHPWEEVVRGRQINDSLDTYCRRYMQILIPPLRNRREDIGAFVEFFLRRMTAGRPPVVEAAAMTELRSLPYYDNVRELRQILAEALLETKEGTLALPELVRDEPAAVHTLLVNILEGRKSDLEAAMDGLEKALIRRAFLRCDLDRARAAGLLGITDINLRYRLKKFNLRYPPPSANSTPSLRAKPRKR